VTSWRRPDVVFDDHTEVDLGGRTVQLWHFGPGNSPGDTVVWVPEAWAAWTGNLLSYRRTVPMLLEGGPAPLPGHPGPLQEHPGRQDGRARARPPGRWALSLDACMAYLRELLEAVTVPAGWG
jgi:cyclase